jgi:cytochrome c-type biogenesis protein CcmH
MVMASFVLLATLIALLAVAVLLRPLWQEARTVALGIAVLVLASTALLYRLVGTPQALDAVATRAPASLDEAIAQLEQALQADPRQAEGWRLLAAAYQRQDQPAKARDAYARAVALLPDDAGLLAEAAQARALAHPTRLFDGEAVALLERALAAEPAHQRARWFLGIAQRQAGRHADAAATWEPLLAQVDASTSASLRKEIDAARAEAGLAPLAEAPAAAPAAGLAVRVTLHPDLAARVRLRGDASVFVIAREPGGTPMPVAVEKRRVDGLPFTATLDDADSPMPTRKLSQLRGWSWWRGCRPAATPVARTAISNRSRCGLCCPRRRRWTS